MATEPKTTAGPPSGYSRRGDRSPRLCFRTVRAGFLAHGSSVIRPLSWAPCRAGDLHVCASPLPGHPYLAPWRAHGLCRATRADHLPSTGPTSASPRAFPAAVASWAIPPPCRLRWTPAHRRGFMHPGGIRHARGVTDAQSCIARRAPMNTTRGSSGPSLRLPLTGGPPASPGFLGGSRRRLQTRSALIRAVSPEPIIRVGDSHLTTMQAWGRVPVRVQLGWTGCPVGCRVPAMSSRVWA